MPAIRAKAPRSSLTGKVGGQTIDPTPFTDRRLVAQGLAEPHCGDDLHNSDAGSSKVRII